MQGRLDTRQSFRGWSDSRGRGAGPARRCGSEVSTYHRDRLLIDGTMIVLGEERPLNMPRGCRR
jgi:hypothetical protein